MKSDRLAARKKTHTNHLMPAGNPAKYNIGNSAPKPICVCLDRISMMQARRIVLLRSECAGILGVSSASKAVFFLVSNPQLIIICRRWRKWAKITR